MGKKQKLLLGEILIELGYLTGAQLEECLERQKELDSRGRHVLIGDLVIEAGYCTVTQVIEAINEQYSRLERLPMWERPPTRDR